MIILGIDPGISGAICAMGMEERFPVNIIKLDATEKDINDFFRMCMAFVDVYAYIERVHALPKVHGAGMFKFGTSYGFLRGCLVSNQIPFEEVLPVRWQRAMGCMTKGDKNISKGRCQQLFPQIKATHAIADAILICEYGRRLRTGTL